MVLRRNARRKEQKNGVNYVNIQEVFAKVTISSESRAELVNATALLESQARSLNFHVLLLKSQDHSKTSA